MGSEHVKDGLSQGPLFPVSSPARVAWGWEEVCVEGPQLQGLWCFAGTEQWEFPSLTQKALTMALTTAEDQVISAKNPHPH